jgi:hypothetical protein
VNHDRAEMFFFSFQLLVIVANFFGAFFAKQW